MSISSLMIHQKGAKLVIRNINNTPGAVNEGTRITKKRKGECA